MNVLSSHKLRHKPAVLDKNRLQTLYLGILITEYEHLVPSFHVLPDVRRKKLEVLVEHRLGSYVERHGIPRIRIKRNLKKHPPEPVQIMKETSVLVHVRRVKPSNRTFRKQARKTHPFSLGSLSGKISTSFLSSTESCVLQSNTWIFSTSSPKNDTLNG